jgi:hypothetical protein
MPVDLEEDWAVIRPNRQSQKVAEPPTPESEHGVVWIGFIDRNREVGTSRVRVPVPKPIRILVQEVDQERDIQHFQGTYRPTATHRFNKMYMFLSEVGGMAIARLHMVRRTLGANEDYPFSFRITGFGYLNSCQIQDVDGVSMLVHSGEGDEDRADEIVDEGPNELHDSASSDWGQ